MANPVPPRWLTPPIDPERDHVLGPADAPISLVEYGSYACAHCRAAHERIVQLRDELGDRLRYSFRHRPLPGNPLADRAAELAERATDPRQFWKAHIALMTRSESLTEADLEAVERELALPPDGSAEAEAAAERVEAHRRSAAASGVGITPTFFINGRRYDGPWDDASFSDAMLGSLGYRVRAAALDFANWPPSSGILLLLATVLALILSNSRVGPDFLALWQTPVGLSWGGGDFTLPLIGWVNDGLLTLFFLVIGLEIKREFTIGHLASRQLAALPIAASVGGMVVPALLYLLLIPSGAWMRGWGVPIGTDTAFAVALIVMMGRRVPIELRIFLTAAAIVDDVAAITIVALFYAGGIDLAWLGAAAGISLLLLAMNRAAIYRVTPYALLGILLWICIHEGGVHATVTGVILSLFIPTRPPPRYQALLSQADAIIAEEVRRSGEEMRHALSVRAMRAIDAIHARLESPAARLLRHVELRSSYIVLPIFAFANAGVAFAPGLLDGREPLVIAIVAGLALGKPVGLVAASWIAVRTGLAVKPDAYDWPQVVGAGCLGGIGFTMSLFIANLSFPLVADYDAAKIAIFIASLISATAGVAVLWWASRRIAKRRLRLMKRVRAGGDEDRPKAPAGTA